MREGQLAVYNSIVHLDRSSLVFGICGWTALKFDVTDYHRRSTLLWHDCSIFVTNTLLVYNYSKRTHFYHHLASAASHVQLALFPPDVQLTFPPCRDTRCTATLLSCHSFRKRHVNSRRWPAESAKTEITLLSKLSTKPNSTLDILSHRFWA